jgi:hypothetical protein
MESHLEQIVTEGGTDTKDEIPEDSRKGSRLNGNEESVSSFECTHYSGFIAGSAFSFVSLKDTVWDFSHLGTCTWVPVLNYPHI